MFPLPPPIVQFSEVMSQEEEITDPNPYFGSVDSNPMSLTNEPKPIAELTCDPQKFTKYYQLGVVSERSEPIDESDTIEVMEPCDEDEDVGTYDPRSRTCNKPWDESLPPTLPSPELERLQGRGQEVLIHGYLNPLSLAEELVASTQRSKVPLPESWDVDTEPLPVYQSPPSEDFPPTFSSLTPQIRVIRTQLGTERNTCCIIT